MTHPQGMWIIGYGSLIFKPPPRIVQSHRLLKRVYSPILAKLNRPSRNTRVSRQSGNPPFHRRSNLPKFHDEFYNVSSPDDLRVYGVAYYIEPQHVEQVKQYLDIREQNGYTAHKVPFYVGEEFIESDITLEQSTTKHLWARDR